MQALELEFGSPRAHGNAGAWEGGDGRSQGNLGIKTSHISELWLDLGTDPASLN